MTSTTIETATPTYHWATAAGAVSSISGLVALAVCISVSAAHSTPAGYAPIPYGITALACVMTLGGLVLLLFRILHADRDEMMRRLEVVDQKLDNVWGIAAVSSIEAKPPHVQQQTHTQRRGRRRKQNGGEPTAENVLPMLSPETKRAARGLAARFVRDQQKRSEDRTEDN